MSRIKLMSFVAAGLALTVLFAGGCIFSPQEDDDPQDKPPVAYVWPDTPDKLMANFGLAYADMDIDQYEVILHPDYKFIFTSNDSWERQEDVNSTGNMFAGNPGVDIDGNPKPGVSSIEVIELTQVLNWEMTPSNHPTFPDSEKALYKVIIVFYLDSATNTITVTSQQLFYAKSEEVDQGDGTTKTRFYLFGQQDIEAEE